MAFVYDYNRAKKEATNALASQGLLSSTAAAGKLADVASLDEQRNAQWDLQNRQFGEQQRQFDTQQNNWGKTFGEQQRQNQQSNAFNWWNALNSLNLSKWQIGGEAPTGNVWANQPSWLGSYWTNKSMASRNIGDPPVSVPSHAEKLPSTLAKVQADRSSALAQQDMALKRASFAESVNQFKAKMQAEGYEQDRNGRWVKNAAAAGANNRAKFLDLLLQNAASGSPLSGDQLAGFGALLGVAIDTPEMYQAVWGKPLPNVTLGGALDPLGGIRFNTNTGSQSGIRSIIPTIPSTDSSPWGEFASPKEQDSWNNFKILAHDAPQPFVKVARWIKDLYNGEDMSGDTYTLR